MLVLVLLMLVAMAIITLLSIIALRLTRQVKEQSLQQAQAQEKLRQAQIKKHEFIVQSLHVIAHNVLEEDLNISEAAIRLTALLNNLKLDAPRLTKYQPLSDLFEKTKGFATHKARNELPKAELRRQDNERESYEREHRDFITTACQLILEDDFAGIAAIL